MIGAAIVVVAGLAAAGVLWWQVRAARLILVAGALVWLTACAGCGLWTCLRDGILSWPGLLGVNAVLLGIDVGAATAAAMHRAEHRIRPDWPALAAATLAFRFGLMGVLATRIMNEAAPADDAALAVISVAIGLPLCGAAAHRMMTAPRPVRR